MAHAWKYDTPVVWPALPMVMSTLLSVSKVRTNWLSSPRNQRNTMGGQGLHYNSCHSIPKAQFPPSPKIHEHFLLHLIELTSVTSLSLCLKSGGHSASWVNNSRLLHDKTILLQAGNVAAGIGQWNFVNFIGVQPDLALSAFEDGGGEALLKLKRHC